MNEESMRIVKAQQKELKAELGKELPQGTFNMGKLRVVNTTYETNSVSYKAIVAEIFEVIPPHLVKEFEAIKDKMTSIVTKHTFEIK